LFRFRLGRFVVSFVVCGVFVYIMLTIFSQAGIELIASRLLDVSDTRSQAWGEMLRQFRRSPLVGVSGEEAQYSENSYLLVAARTGLIGIIPFTIGMIIVASSLLKLQRLRSYLGEEKLLADLITASITGLAVGGMFEGYLYATFSFPLFSTFIFLNLLDYCVDKAKANMRAQQMGMQQQWNEQQQPPYDLEYEPAAAQAQWPATAYQQ
jgi:hypothetical protein